MSDKKFYSTTEIANLLGISRIAVYQKIKKGQIKAVKVGRNYVIDRTDLAGIIDEKTTDQQKKEIKKAVKKTVREYGDTLKWLGNS